MKKTILLLISFCLTFATCTSCSVNGGDKSVSTSENQSVSTSDSESESTIGMPSYIAVKYYTANEFKNALENEQYANARSWKPVFCEIADMISVKEYDYHFEFFFYTIWEKYEEYSSKHADMSIVFTNPENNEFFAVSLYYKCSMMKRQLSKYEKLSDKLYKSVGVTTLYEDYYYVVNDDYILQFCIYFDDLGNKLADPNIAMSMLYDIEQVILNSSK